MLVDYHTHHYRCGHATGDMSDYVQAAIDAGLAEIGLSDHSPVYHLGDDPHPLPGTAMATHEFPNYLREMHTVRDAYSGRVKVRLGVESDYVMGWDEHYRDLWAGEQLDYVIGSVHWLDRWSIFSRELPAGLSEQDVLREYLLTTQAAARSGAYDIIGHLDAIRTRGLVTDLRVTPLVRETVDVLAQSGVTIELNTSGWRKATGMAFPNPEWLALCARAGVPVTLGSDAHRPQDVGAGFDDAVRMLLEAGYREIAAFERRERRMIPLG